MNFRFDDPEIGLKWPFDSKGLHNITACFRSLGLNVNNSHLEIDAAKEKLDLYYEYLYSLHSRYEYAWHAIECESDIARTFIDFVNPVQGEFYLHWQSRHDPLGNKLQKMALPLIERINDEIVLSRKTGEKSAALQQMAERGDSRRRGTLEKLVVEDGVNRLYRVLTEGTFSLTRKMVAYTAFPEIFKKQKPVFDRALGLSFLGMRYGISSIKRDVPNNLSSNGVFPKVSLNDYIDEVIQSLAWIKTGDTSVIKAMAKGKFKFTEWEAAGFDVNGALLKISGNLPSRKMAYLTCTEYFDLYLAAKDRMSNETSIAFLRNCAWMLSRLIYSEQSISTSPQKIAKIVVEEERLSHFEKAGASLHLTLGGERTPTVQYGNCSKEEKKLLRGMCKEIAQSNSHRRLAYDFFGIDQSHTRAVAQVKRKALAEDFGL